MKWILLPAIVMISLLMAACAPVPAQYGNAAPYNEEQVTPVFPPIYTEPYFLFEGPPVRHFHHHDFDREHHGDWGHDRGFHHHFDRDHDHDSDRHFNHDHDHDHDHH